MVIVAVVEPPAESDAEAYWLISSPAIRYAAQGHTRAEAVRNFEQGLAQAIEWAAEEGSINAKRQPELFEYEL